MQTLKDYYTRWYHLYVEQQAVLATVAVTAAAAQAGEEDAGGFRNHEYSIQL